MSDIPEITVTAMNDIPRVTVTELRERVERGYNLAVEVPLDHDLKDLRPLLHGVPVLAEATNVLGVLRAMEIRCHGIQRRMAETGETYRILHLIFMPKDNAPEDGKPVVAAILRDYTFKLALED